MGGTATPDEVAHRICSIVHERVDYVPGSSEVKGTAAQAGAARAAAMSGPRASQLLRDLPYLAVTALNAVVNTLYVVLEVVVPPVEK